MGLSFAPQPKPGPEPETSHQGAGTMVKEAPMVDQENLEQAKRGNL